MKNIQRLPMWKIVAFVSGINLAFLSGCFFPDSRTEAATVPVGLHETMELVFQAATDPGNPFDTYLLKLELTDPAGRKVVIDGFYDGDGNGGQSGRVWKARVSPYMTGPWEWRTVPGDQLDSGLANLSGRFEVVASGNPGGITRDGKYFRFQNGDFIYLVGNFLDFTGGLRSTHTYMSETTSDSQRDEIFRRQRDFHAANKANVYFANKGDYENQSVTPWVGSAQSNDKTRMDLSRWKRFDQYIQGFRAGRMLAEMWLFADDSDFGALSMEHKKRLARYAMARTSAFSHTLYVVCLEWQEGWSAGAVRELGLFLREHNPWNRLLSAHGLTLSAWSFSGESWPGFIASQAGNDSGRQTVNMYALEHDRNHPLPHLGEEFGILEANSNAELRSRMWANFTGGAAGGGTGSDLKALQRFLAQSRAPFQRMRPDNGRVANGGATRFVRAEAGRHYIVYSTSGAFSLDVAGVGLKGAWFNPRDPNGTLGSPFDVPQGLQIFNPPAEADRDWVLWITDGGSLHSGITHPPVGEGMKSLRVGGTPAPPGNLRIDTP